MSNRRPFCFAGTIVTWMAAIASLFLGTHGMGDATMAEKDSAGELNAALGYRASRLIMGNWL